MGGAGIMEKKSGLLNVRRYVLGAAAVIALLALLAGLRAVREIRSLRAALEDTQARLAQSEEARISDLYDLQKEMSSLHQEGTPEGFPSGALAPERDLAWALRSGKIESVLILGDSISDGCNDNHCIFGQAGRAERGLRLIMTDGENQYYENDPQGQGWVKYFREYLLENTSVTTVHNNSIGGKSAKWFNAHKEEAVSQDYDAIVVMLGTNDRRASSPEEFYLEYASLLSWLKGRCEYLQVLTPIPAFAEADASTSMDTRQVADVVLELCADKGYACANLYTGLLSYAQLSGYPLDEYSSDGTHPNAWGYLQLWRLIAEELGINLAIGDWYDRGSVYTYEPVCIGQNREDLTEDVQPCDVLQGEAVFPIGISYYRPCSVPFHKEMQDYGGSVITYRYKNGAGKQIFKHPSYDYDLIRYIGADGKWGEWHVTNRDQFAPEP